MQRREKAEIKEEMADTRRKNATRFYRAIPGFILSSAFDPARKRGPEIRALSNITGWILSKDGEAFSKEAAALGWSVCLKTQLTEENNIPANN
jgi:hypothetical protein